VVWCGECYTPPQDFRFHHQAPKDEAGFEWKRPGDESRHMQARAGDHLVTPFQCDLCIFRNLKGRNPLPQDRVLMACIRQVNLDALWGRESGTVHATRRSVFQTIQMWNQVGLEPTFPSLGPYPVGDPLGYSVAIAMIVKSREKGRYEDYQQFETIRKVRAAYSNVYMCSVNGVSSLRTLGGESAKFHLNDCPTNSLWFERFTRGCLSRMGQIVKQDMAVSLRVMHAMLQLLEESWSQSRGDERRCMLLANVGAYITIAFCGSFRGPEVFLVDLFGLRKYFEMNPSYEGVDYVVIPLLGRFKGENGLAYHLTPLAAETQSGIKVKLWIKRLLEVRWQQGKMNGPAFVGWDGKPLIASGIEPDVLDLLLKVQERDHELIPKEVNVLEEYGISRSFRRGATSEARARGVKGEDVDLANRWRNYENSKGKKPRQAMKDHYSDIRLMIPALLKFSQAL